MHSFYRKCGELAISLLPERPPASLPLKGKGAHSQCTVTSREQCSMMNINRICCLHAAPSRYTASLSQRSSCQCLTALYCIVQDSMSRMQCHRTAVPQPAAPWDSRALMPLGECASTAWVTGWRCSHASAGRQHPSPCSRACISVRGCSNHFRH